MDIFDIPPGARWPTEIDRSLRDSSVIVGLLSPAALSSENVLNEWDWAIANGRRLILLLIEKCEIPFHYVSRSYLDFTDGQPKAFDTLLQALVRTLPDTQPVISDRAAGDDLPAFSVTTTLTRWAATMVGRDDELGQLRGYMQRALDSEGSLVLLGGEAGIGKTTISAALCREAAQTGALVLAGGCYDLTTTAPYGPWIEIIRAFPEGDGLPPVPDQLRAGGGLTGVDSQAALFELAGRFLARVAAVRPLVLLLEDQHWSDQASLDLLRYLSRVLSEQRVLFVATYRDDEIGRDHALSRLMPMLVREGRAHRLHLRQLSHEALLALVREKYLLSPHDESRLVAYLERLAEGNPFFTHELLFMLEEQRNLTPAAGGWRLGNLTATGVPSLIQQVIDGRLSRLDAATRSMLDVAAVIGYEVPLGLLRDAHDGSTGELDASLRSATDHHLLLTQPGQNAVRFSHALVRQTIYEDIPLFRRQDLHRQIGEVLSRRSNPDAAMVSDHFHGAGDERALGWLELAADQAQRLFAPASVIEYASLGIDLAAGLGVDESLVLYRLRGLARESIGDFDGARNDHETILRLAPAQDDQLSEWQALLDLGALWASRDYERTREYCEEAVVLARDMEDSAALGHSLNRLGNWHLNSDRPGEAIRHHDHALLLFETIDDRRGIASTLDLAAVSNLLSGTIGEAVRLWERAIPLLRLLDDRQNLCSALTNVIVATRGGYGLRTSRVLGHPASIGRSAEDAAADAIRIARSIDSRGHECYALGIWGQVAVTLGDVHDGLQHMVDASEMAENIRHHLWSTIMRISLGASCLDMLISDRARDLLQNALDRAEQMTATFQVTCSTGFLASAHVMAGNYDRADWLLGDRVNYEQPPASMAARECWFAAVELALARGDIAAALSTIETLIKSIPDGPGDLSPYLTGLFGEILLAHGRLDDAERELHGAHEVATRLHFPLALWRVLATQRRIALARGQHDEATRAESAAREIIDGLAAQLDDEDMRETFLTNALARLHEPPPAGVSRSAANPAGLTAREVEVLRLVAEGLTDIEVSDKLFISPRTVSQHLRSIYNKLDVSNRTAAVHAATERNAF
jgi:DNA-binding CsgD family transcriptional regulator/tetratricopeptide (TPR) repeat protein